MNCWTSDNFLLSHYILMILNIHRLPTNTMDLQHTQNVYHKADINKHRPQRVGALFLQYNK